MWVVYPLRCLRLFTGRQRWQGDRLCCLGRPLSLSLDSTTSEQDRVRSHQTHLSKSANWRRLLDDLSGSHYGLHLVQLTFCVCKLEIHRLGAFSQGLTSEPYLLRPSSPFPSHMKPPRQEKWKHVDHTFWKLISVLLHQKIFIMVVIYTIL